MSSPPEPDELDRLLESGFRYALSLCHERAEAEDLLQDAWVSLLRANGARERGYLFSSIRSRFIDRHRRARLLVVEIVPAEELERLAVDEEGSGDAILAAERSQLHAALGDLGAEEREAVYLSVVEGCTAAEIAELTSAPRGSVLSRIHRGKKKLARTLRREEAQA